MARESSHHSDGYGQPDCRRDEVLNRQGRHLDEVAQRRFARIGLPIGVGEKTDGRVKSQVGRDNRRAKILRIERQIGLRPLQHVHQQEAKNAEAQYRGRVEGPALLNVLPHTRNPISESFKPAQYRMHESAPAFEDIRYIGAERFRAD